MGIGCAVGGMQRVLRMNMPLLRSLKMYRGPRVSIDMALLTEEWRLHKAESAQSGFGTPDTGFGTISEVGTWTRKMRVLSFLAFDGSGFSPTGPLVHQVSG